ncbi:hypothetical protein V6N13_090437 [Hibiscus sabdariffa]
MNTSRVDEEANQRKDGQIESMQQSRTWVRVEDIGHSAGNETIDRSTKTFVIQEEEMDWVKVSTEQYEEDQVFIDEGFPARDEVAGDCDASDSVEKDDYGGKQNVGPNISTSMENHYVPINVQPLSPTVREQGGHVESLVKANPAGLEGSNLFEVGIASVNSFELRTTFGPGPKGQLQITESDGQSISVSHKSRLQEVQVEVLDEAQTNRGVIKKSRKLLEAKGKVGQKMMDSNDIVLARLAELETEPRAD